MHQKYDNQLISLENLDEFDIDEPESDNGNSEQAWLLGFLLIPVALIALAFILHRWMKKNKDTKKAFPNGKLNSDSLSTGRSFQKRGVPLLSIMTGDVSLPSLEEFEKLISYKNDLGQRSTISQGLRYNREGGFNLVPENLPFDHNRIRLKRPVAGCDYVNAAWITPPYADDPTYDQLIYTSYIPFNCVQFAVGQEPMPNTMDHYFRMVHEQKFDYVFSFTKEPRKLPLKVNDVYDLHQLTLKVLKRSNINYSHHNDNCFHEITLQRTELSLFNTNESVDQYRHNFIYIELDFWPDNDDSSTRAIEAIVCAMCLMRNEMTLKGSSLKVLATDIRGGVGASAVFLSMYEIMQELDESLTANNKLKQYSNP